MRQELMQPLSGIRIAATATFCAAMVLLPSIGRTQTSVPYDYFRTLTQQEKSTFQFKLSFIGRQSKVHPTLVLHSEGESPNVELFDEIGDSSLISANDKNVESASISASEIDSLIAGLGTLTGVTDPPSEIDGLSFSISFLVRSPIKHGFEAVVASDILHGVFDQLRGALATNAAAYRLIQERACRHRLLQSSRPVDVTQSTKVYFSGIRPVWGSQNFVGTVTVKNTSSVPIAAPISVVLLDLPADVKLVNASGLTCGMAPMGRPYIDVHAGSSLDPGQEVQARIELGNHFLFPIGGCGCETDSSRWCDPTAVTVPQGACPNSDACICTPRWTILSGPGAR